MVDIFDLETAKGELVPLAEKVWRHCEAKGLSGRTVTLKVKFADFQQITRSRTMSQPFSSSPRMLETAQSLLRDVFPTSKGIRLLGVTVSALDEKASDVDAAQMLLL